MPYSTTSQTYTPKTLVENEEQVFAFSAFIKAQQDLIQEKNLELKTLESEDENEIELVIGVDCEGISR